jgi:hypothetical protein
VQARELANGLSVPIGGSLQTKELALHAQPQAVLSSTSADALRIREPWSKATDTGS